MLGGRARVVRGQGSTCRRVTQLEMVQEGPSVLSPFLPLELMFPLLDPQGNVPPRAPAVVSRYETQHGPEMSLQFLPRGPACLLAPSGTDEV